jgi:hypothetical protein
VAASTTPSEVGNPTVGSQSNPATATIGYSPKLAPMPSAGQRAKVIALVHRAKTTGRCVFFIPIDTLRLIALPA